MAKPAFDPARVRVLISNDDGIEAPGLKLLERIARGLFKDVWVVAPETEQSATSHSLTIRRPLRVRKAGRQRFAVDGTPTDAVLLAVNHIMKDHKPSLCLSGINRGANLGEDVIYSGTVAAAMEATLLGVPAIALSQVTHSPQPVLWATAEAHAAAVLDRLVHASWPSNVMVNVNFPNVAPDAVKGVRVAGQGRHKIGDELLENRDPRGIPYYWIGTMRREDATRKGTDIWAANDGYIAVTPLHLDFTHRPTSRRLAAMFAKPDQRRATRR